MRSPFDGFPYYCATCGRDCREMSACDEDGCALEPPRTSLQRGRDHLAAARADLDSHEREPGDADNLAQIETSLWRAEALYGPCAPKRPSVTQRVRRWLRRAR